MYWVGQNRIYINIYIYIYICTASFTLLTCTHAKGWPEPYIYIYAQLRFLCSLAHMHRVGQNRIYTPHVTVYLVFFLPELPYIHRIYMYGFGPPYTFLNHHQHVCILERARTPPMFEFDTHEHLRFPFKPGSHR
jgi:hypothetical protein